MQIWFDPNNNSVVTEVAFYSTSQYKHELDNTTESESIISFWTYITSPGLHDYLIPAYI